MPLNEPVVRVRDEAAASGLTIYNPEGLSRPLGQYSHVARVRPKELVFLAGMLAADRDGRSVGFGDVNAQLDQIFENIDTALQSAGASFANIVQFTTYLVSPDLIPELMKYRLARFPEFFPSGNYPPNTLLIVDRLVHPEFLAEVHAIAAIPE